MSSRDFAENLHLSSKNKSLESILKLLQNLQKQNPAVENIDLVRNLIYSPLIDIHNTTTEATKEPDVEEEETQEHQDRVGCFKIIPTSVNNYTLTHDNSDADGIDASATVNKKFGGGAKTDGDSIIAINHHSSLNPDMLLFSFWIYLPSENTSTSFKHLIKKGVTDRYRIGISNSNNFRFFYGIDNINNSIDHILPTDQWVHVVAQARDGRQELYFDGVLVDSANTTGELLTNDGDLCIFGQGDNKVRAGTILAHFLMGDGFIDSDWVTDSMNGKLDVSASSNGVYPNNFDIPANEIHTIEYEYHERDDGRATRRYLINGSQSGSWNTSSNIPAQYNTLGANTYNGFFYEGETDHGEECPNSVDWIGVISCRIKKWVRRPKEITYIPFYNDLEPLPNSDLI